MDGGSSSGIKPDGRSTGESNHKQERYIFSCLHSSLIRI